MAKKVRSDFKKNLEFVLPAAMFTFFLIFFSAVSFTRYYSLQLFHYDFGIFSRIIWQLSRFQIPYIDHFALGKVMFLGDHFNPSLILVAPFYWITSDPRILLFEQALATVGGGVIIWLILRKLKFPTIASLLITMSYLFFAGIENPLVTDWHPESTAGFFLLLFFYLFYFTNKRLLYWLVAIIFLGFKESNGVSFILLLIWLLIIKREKWKEIIGFMALSLAWFLVTTKLVIPFIAGRYFYTPTLPTAPKDFFINMIDLPVKRTLIFDAFISFGFLPLFSVAGLLPVLGEIAIRFIPTSSFFQNYTLAFHYNVYLAIFLGLATIFGIQTISKRFQKKHIVILVLAMYLFFMAMFTARKITTSPINVAISPIFWHELKPLYTLTVLQKNVPKEGSLMSQNNLLAIFAARKEDVYFLSDSYKSIKPQIILFDLSPQQNPNNQWRIDEKTLATVKKSLQKDSSYHRVPFMNPDLYLYIRK